MFEKYLEKILKDLLGEFIEEIDSKELSVGIWSGKIAIKNLKLKKNVLQKANIPIIIKHSSIKGLSIKIPWKNLFESPLVITIDSLLLLCQFSSDSFKGQQRAQAMIDLVNKTIKQVGEQLISKSKQKSELKEKSGLIDRLSYKMLDNLYLSIKNIHLRFEEKQTGTSLKYGYSFGCSLQSLQMYAVGPNNEKIFVDRSKQQPNATLIRKKLQMKNLAIYCNYGQNEYITQLPFPKSQSQAEQKLLKAIYTREKFNNSQNKNNYILIMNVTGLVDEDHREGRVHYDAKMNFEKLIVKLDKEVLNSLLVFSYSLQGLRKKSESEITQKQFSKQDDLLIRKYCNGYLSDFRVKDLWTPKDRDQLFAILSSTQQSAIIQKVKYIIINQVSVSQLSKFFALKGQDLDKGLLEVSREIKDLKEPKIKVGITVPQITLYLVNEFSESILELNILSISLNYYQKIIAESKLMMVDFIIQSVTAVNNNLYILNADKESKNQPFFQCCAEVSEEKTSVDAKFSPFSFFYDFQTIFKINELFHLKEIDVHYRSIAADKLQNLEAKVNKKVQETSHKLLVRVSINKPKVTIREGKVNWTFFLQKFSFAYEDSIDIILQGLKIMILRGKEQFLFLEPFNIHSKINYSAQGSQVEFLVSPLVINFQAFIYSSLNNLNKYLFINKKNEIINKCSKSCEVFLKQERWKKCFITLLDDKLYGWQNQSDYPLFIVRVRCVAKVKRGKIDILQISDKKKGYELGFKEDKILDQWATQLQQISLQDSKKKASIKAVKLLDSQLKAKGTLQLIQIKLKNNSIYMSAKTPQDEEEQCITIFTLQTTEILLEKSVKNNEQILSLTLSSQQIKFWQNGQSFINKQGIQPLFTLNLKSYSSPNVITKQNIDIKFSRINIIFKPDSILRLLGFANQIQSNKKVTNFHLEQPKSEQIVGFAETMIAVSLSRSSIVFHNILTKREMILLALQQLSLKMRQKGNETVLQSRIQDIRLFDLTGYPQTIYQVGDKRQIKPYLIAGPKQNQNQILVKVTINSIEKEKEKESSLVIEAQIKDLKINCLLEPVLRIIDYLNNQILGILYYPQFFVEFHSRKRSALPLDYHSNLKREDQLLKQQYLRKMGKETIKKMLQNPNPPFFHITLHKSILHIPSDYQSSDGISLHIQKTGISNKLAKQNIIIDGKAISINREDYLIEMANVDVVAVCGQQILISSRVEGQPTNLKLQIGFFGGAKDYQFAYEDHHSLSNIIAVDLEVSLLKLNLNEIAISTLLKSLNRNIFHEDGVGFLFFYELYQGQQSILRIKIHSELLIIDLKLLEEKQSISTQFGRFLHEYQRTPASYSKLVTSRYMISRFIDEKGDPKEVLASRKIFGRMSSNRGTFYAELLKDNKLQSLSEDTSFQYQSKHNRKDERYESILKAKEMMVIADIDFLIYLSKIQIKDENTSPPPKAFLPAKIPQPKPASITGQQQATITLENILICSQVPDTDIIMSILSSISIIITKESTKVFVPDLQAFISNQQHLTCKELAEMKKRTLLKHTHLRIYFREDQIEFNLGKCFFKLSINDVRSLSLLSSHIQSKYLVYSTQKSREYLAKKQIDSISYHSMEHKQDTTLFTPNQQQKTLGKTVKILQPQIVTFKTLEKIKQGEQILQTSFDHLGKKPLSPIEKSSPHSSISLMEKEIIYNLEAIQIMVVDDLNDFLTPLIYLNLKLDLNHFHKLFLELYADYFNLRNTLWEPMLQKTTLQLDYGGTWHLKTVDEKEHININITSNFIENILKTLNHKQLKSSRLFFTSHYVDKDEINSWIIINQLGEDIRCQSLDQPQRGVYIPKGEVQTLSFLSKAGSKGFKQNQKEEVFVRLTIAQRTIIKKLKISQLGLKRLLISSNGQNCTIIKNLFIDLSKNIKYLTLSSEIVFENRSDATIPLKQAKLGAMIYLQPFKSQSLPLYCTLQSIMHCSGDNQEHYQSLHQLQTCARLQINGKQFNITFNHRKFRKHFVFHPLYKITNLLPFPVILNFKEKEGTNLHLSLQLSSYERQNCNFGYLYKPLQELQVSFWIENYQYTDFSEMTKFIEIRDYNQSLLTIRSQQYKDSSSPTVHIALLVNNIIKNITSQTFSALVDGHCVQAFSPEQYLISQKNQFTLVLNGEKSDPLFLTKKYSYFSLLIQDRGMFNAEKDFCLFKNKIELDSSIYGRLNFNINEILPKYLIKNDNSYSIIVKQNGSGVGEFQNIKSCCDDPVFWYLDGSGKRRNPLFRFTLEGSPYDWSCPINVQSIKKCYFVLRNKFNYVDAKYFMSNVRKIKQVFRISLRQLNNEEIPYIIKNSTSKYCMIIDNLKVTLKPGEESFFAWEDPSINNKKISVWFNHISISQHNHPDTKIQYEIKVDSFEQNAFKCSDENLQIEVINQPNRQIYVFSDDPKDGIATILTKTMKADLPLRIALINNSASPAVHLFDLTTQLCLQHESYSSSKQVTQIELKDLQLDNQTKPLTFFPVVLNTDIKIRVQKAKNLEMEFTASPIKINIEEDFITDLTALATYLQALSASASQQAKGKQEGFFISKLILPKLSLELEIQTKKFSIQTQIVLQKPQICSYPWKDVPYPIKTIAFNILSHLSISPWAFISSFGKGLSLLITEQQTSRGFEGFLQQLVGGFSNSINGMVGMIVGHDIEKVDNFIDGLNKGFSALGASLFEILPNFEGDYSPINIIKEIGCSAVNLFFKPITGILRMTLRISEGIKKTTKFQFESSSKKFKKRFAIVFYQREQTFFAYDGVKSELMNCLKKALFNEIRYFYLIDMVLIEYRLRNKRYLLAIGAEQLLLFDLSTQKPVWKIQIQRIAQMQVHNLCTIQFLVLEGEQRRRYQVDINSQQSVKRVMQTIEKIQKLSSIQL